MNGITPQRSLMIEKILTSARVVLRVIAHLNFIAIEGHQEAVIVPNY